MMRILDTVITVLGTIGIVGMWSNIYDVMWANHWTDVVCSGIIFLGVIGSWWLDYFRK
jgi:hypothetical protein